MLKLFKAAIRSLKNMKTTIIGLTILIFLSSTIFTLLSDVRNAYSKKFEDYNNISRLHDITFDLDLNNEGTLGSSSAYTKEKEENYMVKGTEGQNKVLLTQGYKPINSFINSEIRNTAGDLVVSEESTIDGKKVVTNVFDTAQLSEEFQLAQKGDGSESRFIFNKDTSGNIVGTIEPKSDYHINMFKLVDGDQRSMMNEHAINIGDTITWDRNDYRLSTETTGSTYKNSLGEFSYNTNWWNNPKEIYFKPTKKIYINKKTKIATMQQPINPTSGEWFVIDENKDSQRNIGESLLGLRFDRTKKEHWDSNKGYNITKIINDEEKSGKTREETINWENAPLFKDLNDQKRVSVKYDSGWTWSIHYLSAKNDSDLYNPSDNKYSKFGSLKLQSFKWPKSFGNIAFEEEKPSAVLKKGVKYEIPDNWFEEIKNEIYYTKHFYNLNNYSKWTGSYKEWIETLSEKELDELKSFSFWTKTVRKDGYNYDSETDKTNPNGDFIGVLLTHDIKSNIYKFTYNNNGEIINSGEGDTSIHDIEDFVTEEEETYDRSEFLQHFANITNKDKLSERVSIISNGAKLITKANIEKHVREIAGESNVGVRKTMTVSSFDKTLNKAQVFHFIDASRNTLDGKTETVNKMYYEQLNNTALLSLDSTKIYNNKNEEEENLGKYSPPSSFSTYMINSIFRGYHIDPDYFDANVIFKKVDDNSLEELKLVKVKTIDTSKGDEVFYITKLNDHFIVFDKELKIFEKDDLTYDSLTYENLAAFMINTNLTIDGTIGEKGWFKISEKNKNIIIPVQYRNLPSEATERAVKSEEYDTFLAGIKSTLNGIITMGDNPWIKPQVLDAINLGIEKSMKENMFYSVMETGFIDRAVLGKLLFDSLYYADLRDPSQPILNRIFTDMISHIKNLINKETTLEAKKIKFKKEFSNLSQMISNIFGKAFPVDLGKLSELTSDPIEFLDICKDMITSISSNKWLSGIKKWYDKNWEGVQPGVADGRAPDGSVQYNYFGTRELIAPLFDGGIDKNKFKDSLQKLIINLDFNKIEDQLIDFIKNKLDSSDAKKIQKVFEKIQKSFNNEEEGKSLMTHNLQYIAWNLIDKLDIELTMNYIINSYQDYSFKQIVDGEEKWFLGAFTTQVDIVSAITKGLFANPDEFENIKNILINGLNLSFKTENASPIGTIKAPSKDEEKLDLFDLQELESINYNKIKENIIILNKFNDKKGTKEETKKAISLIESLYSEKLVSEIGVEKLARRLEITYSQLCLKKFKGKHTQEELNPDKNNNPIEQIGKNATIADVALWTMQNNFKKVLGQDGSNKRAYDAISDVVKSSEYAAGANSLVMYNWYFKFIDFYIEDCLSSGININEAAEQAFDILNFILDVSISEEKEGEEKSLYEILTQEEQVDDFTFLGITNLTASVLIDTKKIIQEENIKNHPKIELIFKEIKDSLKNKDKTIDFLKNNFEDFIFQIGAFAYSKDKEEVNLTEIGHETSRWYLGLKHILLNKDASPIYHEINYDYNSFKALVNLSNSSCTQSEVFKFLGISQSVSSTYLGTIFPMVAKANVVHYNQDEKDNGNIGFVINGKIRNFAKDSFEDIRSSFKAFVPEEMLPFEVEQHGSIPLKIDMYYLKHITKKMKENDQKMIFDLDVADLIDSVIDSSTEVIQEESQIRFLNIGAYVAKVSESYMKKNNKEGYTKELPDNIEDMIALLNTVDSKYIVNINNQKFLILGKETAVDYMYPVLDEANLNVDTKNQAIVFTNTYGFERIVQANQHIAIKEYLTIRKDDWKGGQFNSITGKKIDKNEQHSVDLDKIYYANDSVESLKEVLRIKTSNEPIEKVFLATEKDPINPERSMRVTTVQTVIDSVSQLQFFGTIFLLILVGVITIFISIRYIDNRRVVIGILRAKGYSKMSIASSFTIFGIFTGFIGGVLGYITGHFMQIPVMNAFSSFWTVPTSAASFNLSSMLLTTLAPIAGMILLIIFSTLWVLREKTINLMSGNDKIKFGLFSKILIKPFKKFSIITRFYATLVFNSFFKLISLSFAILLSAVVGIFSISSIGVFDKAINETYAQRDYKYSIDLHTPTLEGGGYDIVDKNNLDSLQQLYIPMGNNLEGNTYTWDYFKPGPSSIMDLKYANGNKTEEGRAHMMSKSTLDITVNTSINANPWDLAKNSMPDSQYVSALENTSIAAVEMMFTQIPDTSKKESLRKEYLKLIEKWRNGSYPVGEQKFNPWLHSGAQKYIEKGKNGSHFVDSYYLYTPTSNNEGKFIERIWSSSLNKFDNKDITTEVDSRERFRNFLTNAYQDKKVNDYLMIYGGVAIDKNMDETYSWAQGTLGKEKTKVKFNGIQIEQDSEGKIKKGYSNPITEKGKDIKLEIFNEYKKSIELEKKGIKIGTENNPIPIAPNEVVKRRWNIGVGDILKSEIYNQTDRYLYKFKNSSSNKNDDDYKKEYFVKVVAINSTYINTEIITIQDAVNKMIGLNNVKWRKGIKPFNGVFTKNNVPSQAIESLSLYSPSGYWAAMEGINNQGGYSNNMFNIAKHIFGTEDNEGALLSAKDNKGNPVYYEAELNNIIKRTYPSKTLSDLRATFNKDPSSLNDEDKALITSIIKEFTRVYGSTIYSAATASLSAKDIESGFVGNIAGTVNVITNSFVAITSLISLIVMVIISTMIVNENKKKIATFSVMGYSEFEKIRMFIFIYIPFMLLAIAISIPLAIAAISIFNNAILITTNMALPLVANPLNIFIATVIILFVLLGTIALAYLAIKRIKPIYILKGDD